MGTSNNPQSGWQAFVCDLGYTEAIELKNHVRIGLIASVVAVGILLFASNMSSRMGLFWVFGLAFGVVLQRSRFCFASAFRDIFLLRHARNMKGVLFGLAVATVGFAIVMNSELPNTGLGLYPSDAHILPFGVHIILGGLLFGFGMVISGGCVSGSIYRMGEGYVASWVAFGGLLIGLLVSAFTWNWWWENQIANGPRLWLAEGLGYGGAIAATLGALLLVYLLLIWWESRGGIVIPDMAFKAGDEDTFAGKLNNTLRRVFVHGWPAVVGGGALGLLNLMLYTYEHPWGFTGELSRWVIDSTNSLGVGPGTLAGADSLPGCALEVGGTGVFSHMLFLVIGMIFGSFVAALFSGEFKIRIPRERKRYVQALGGGTLMGYGAGIAMGCTIGGFFSAIPSLGLNGWIFALFLAAGAWLGTLAIQRIG